MSPRSGISVVLPVLNEAERIGAALSALSKLTGLAEVIVVDGGSSDQTPELVRAHPSTRTGLTRMLQAERGRALQMNAGARAARSAVLLFLHADVRLPKTAASWVSRTLADPKTVAGAFRTHTVDDTSPPSRARWLRLADLRSRYTRLPLR